MTKLHRIAVRLLMLGLPAAFVIVETYSQLSKTGAVVAGFQSAANNPYFGRVLY